MAQDDRLPSRSYALIQWLDETIPRPTFPQTAGGYANLNEAELRRLAYIHGYRTCVDNLVDQMEYEIAQEEQDEGTSVDVGAADGPALRFPKVFGSNGEVLEAAPPAHRVGGEAS